MVFFEKIKERYQCKFEDNETIVVALNEAQSKERNECVLKVINNKILIQGTMRIKNDFIDYEFSLNTTENVISIIETILSMSQTFEESFCKNRENDTKFKEEYYLYCPMNKMTTFLGLLKRDFEFLDFNYKDDYKIIVTCNLNREDINHDAMTEMDAFLKHAMSVRDKLIISELEDLVHLLNNHYDNDIRFNFSTSKREMEGFDNNKGVFLLIESNPNIASTNIYITIKGLPLATEWLAYLSEKRATSFKKEYLDQEKIVLYDILNSSSYEELDKIIEIIIKTK